MPDEIDRKPSESEIEFARLFIDSNEFFRKGLEATLRAMEMFAHIDEIYAAYAESLGKPKLTDIEKKQAVLNHVLDNP